MLTYLIIKLIINQRQKAFKQWVEQARNWHVE